MTAPLGTGVDAAATTWAGQSIPRKEDGRLVRGQGAFVDDLWAHRMGYVHFVRSPYAHARIVSIDVSKAEAIPGVYATLVGSEVEKLQEPFMQMAPPPGAEVADYCLAVGKARFMGEPVAVVLADSRETARDAADLINVEYDPLPVVVDGVASAGPDAPVLHDGVGSNQIWHGEFDYGDVEWAIENADHVVRIDRLHFHRFSSTPLECNAALVNWDAGTSSVEFRANLQMPQFAAMFIGPAIGVPIDRMRFAVQDIGGGFGIKITSYPYLTALALLSRKAGRPAKWTEYRSEHMLASAHGSERTFLDIEVPVMADGTILGISARAFDDVGAFPRYEPLGGVIWSQVAPGCYHLKHIHVDYTTTVTNKCPVGPNRGYSRLQHLWLLERVVDIVAQELDFDPVELRKHNYIQPDEYPYETPNGSIYDSGDLPRSLDRALELIDYEEARTLQSQARLEGRRIGIGIGSTLDSGTNNFAQARLVNPYLPFSGNTEAANVKLDLYGEVVVALGTVPQGQGHETTAAQVVADVLHISPDDVHVLAGNDTERNTYVGHSGTYASQFAVTGLGAALGAAEMLKAEILQVAAAVLDADESQIELAEGAAHVRGNAEHSVPYSKIANLALANVGELPIELRGAITLSCRYVYQAPFELPDLDRKVGNLTLTYASQVHACVVEIDEETGQVSILDYAAVDDCGRRIHPQIVEGQVHGAASHGIAASLYEAIVYDENGQLLTANFYDYHAATALDVPALKTDAVESPSPFSPNGAKGMGEGGGAPLHAICSAIQDAIGDTGAIVTHTFNGPEVVFNMLRDARVNGPRGITVVSR